MWCGHQYDAGGKPHAVSAVSGARGGAYRYDANGNLICRGATAPSPCPAGQQLTWTPAGYPEDIHLDPDDRLAFSYGPERQRIRETRYVNDTAVTTRYTVGPHFEVEVAGGVTAYRSYVFFGERAIFARRSSTQTGLLEEYYIHRDHLGSVDRLTPATTNLAAEGYRFDAFGKRRHGNWSADSGDTLLADTTVQWTERGFTGHEHLDAVKLIHMNGRVQDPIVGRMISADPLLGDLTDPQSLNRYSYVRNNPLALTDPSGFDEQDDGVRIRYGQGWCTAGGCARLDVTFNPALYRGGPLTGATQRVEQLDRVAGALKADEPAGATAYSGGYGSAHNFNLAAGLIPVRVSADYGRMIKGGIESVAAWRTEYRMAWTSPGTLSALDPTSKFAQFFEQNYYAAAVEAASYDVDVTHLLGLAAYESGWGTNRHTREFNNPFGVTPDGVNPTRFKSISAAWQYWGRTFGPRVANTGSDPSRFIHNLLLDNRNVYGPTIGGDRRGAYNSVNPDWGAGVGATIESVQQRLPLWSGNGP